MSNKEFSQRQQLLRAKSVHPSGALSNFAREEVERSIDARLETTADRFADRIAIKVANESTTYAELNAAANRTARAILSLQGNEPEPIGLWFKNGAPLAVAMLGVIKAGKFFVTLDPSFPRSRIASVLEDCQTRLVLTDRQSSIFVREIVGTGCRVLEVESVDPALSPNNLDRRGSSRDVAAIVYTSGSTGQPKGVIWDHRDLLHRIFLRTKENRLCQFDRVALLPSGTANAVTNLFFALLNGATLVPFDVQTAGVTALSLWLLDERISICPISSPLFRNLCESLTGEERFPDLRVIRLRSETVYKSDVDLYKRHFPPGCLFVTGLSTSETGQLTTYLIDHDTEITGGEVPVGYPVEDKDILLLDESGNDVGNNEVGEIVVRSRHLSPGYWRRPQLDRTKFKPDPEGGDWRLCFTGDMGLMPSDGCLIHKGRKDFRVKVRGYGVEIAEIEKTLLGHSAVRDAVVIADHSDGGETRLLAYYTVHNRPGPTVSELRRFLRENLPDYMIPSTFVLLESIPLTSNGKVNRRALPAPGASRPALDTSFTAPQNPVEDKLVGIWWSLLRLDQIGTHDNFFDLGGHSLLAMQALSRIHNVFRVEVSLHQFFAAPTIAALAQCIQNARPFQGRLEPFSFETVSRERGLPLSFAQQRLWFLDQLDPSSPAYNLFSAINIVGPLDVASLELSFNEIIKRHESLRTVFTAVSGEPLQTILPSIILKIAVVDLRQTASDSEREYDMRRLMRQEAHRPFNLATGPLLRVTILRLTDDEFILLLCLHHIVFDAWSRGILLRELSALYNSYSRGRPSELPVLQVQYADFAQWQRKQLQNNLLEHQAAYWRHKLDGVLPLHLPCDRSRPSVQSARGARQHFDISETLSAALKNLANQHGATLFMTLLAAYQTLLHRYSEQTDLVVGCPIMGRSSKEVEEILGFFLNMLVFRGDLSGDPTFRELLGRVRETCLQAYTHQDFPFEKLVEELHLERSLSYNPLFQVTFTFQNTPPYVLELDRLKATEIKVDPGIARMDLHLLIMEEESRLKGYLDYNTDLWDGGTIVRMLGHFQTLLQAIVSNPERRISELPLLTAAEKQQLLVDWNATEKDYPRDRCIHELFEAQANKSPDAMAVVFEDQKLTYRELNERANRLAHYLTERGVGPEVLVGICLERSLNMVVALLAVLKAGGAYVPLDPVYPQNRLAFLLEDSKVSVLLTEIALMGSLPEHRATAVFIDTDWNEIAQKRGDNPGGAVRPENLAYVIYTSGSTGTPKGVAVEHRGLCNLGEAQIRTFDANKDNRVLQYASLSFDASIFEIVWALNSGATLFLGTRNSLLPGPSLVQFLHDHAISTVTLPPSTLAELPLATLPELRTLTVAGEVCSAGIVSRWAGDRRFFNLYGPTEATIWATVTECSDGISPLPIGRPILNTKIYILDSHLNPSPIGVPGELYISGVGVARGYLNRADLTAERFMPNPFSDRPGTRLYRTGDLARYRPDGNIEFLGRIDNQVKVRGYRIELGEIEAVLSGHPQVKDAVVELHEDNTKEKRLVAYVVAGQRPLQHGKLRDFLKQTLPDYMIPSVFVFLDSLPLTPSGKVDRKALPAPDQTRPELENRFVEPRTPAEKTLAGIWAEVLKLEKIGVHDNFFELGGHSLLATQLMARINDSFQTDIPLRTLFEKPTIAELAAVVTEGQARKNFVQADVSDVLTELESISEEEAKKILEGNFSTKK